MQSIIISLLNKYGYLAVLFLIAIENIFPPIPSEVILTFAGFMSTYTSMNVILIIVFSTLGSLIGAIVLYYIGRILNKERLEKIISGKIGQILRLKKNDIEKADAWFDKRGNKTVFFCRFVPIVRSLISIPAGMSEMPFLKFLIYTTFGTVIWNTVLVVLGSIMGGKWTVIVDFINTYAKVTLIILVLVLISGIVFWFYKRDKKRS